MSEFERFILSLIIFFAAVGVVLLAGLKLWLPRYRKHSYLGRMAIQSLGAWAWFIPMVWLTYIYFGNRAVYNLGYVCCVTGTMPIVLLQYRFKFAAVADISTSGEQPVFDERDYRIGQEALQNAYLAFWILVWIVGLTLFITRRDLELSYWIVLSILPVTATIVSMVHSISILVLYHRDNRETEAASDA